MVTRAFPLKKSPKVEWFFACPQGNNACKCNSGHSFSYFSSGKEEAKAQKFNFVVTPARIDVNDMKITRQDGTVYFAKGKYEVDMDVKFTNGNTYSCNLISQGATKTGLDVMRGFRYVVTTTAISEEGSTLQSTEEIDLR